MALIARTVYNQNGAIVSSTKDYTSNGLTPKEYNSKKADEYYREFHRFPYGPEAASKVIETVNAISLAKCLPGLPTLVNLFSTIAESAQIVVSQSETLPKIAKEGALAWFQVIAGSVGFLSVGKSLLFKHEDEDFSNTSLSNKIALSGSSLLNIASLASTYMEKSLLLMVSYNKADRDGHSSKSEHRTCLTSAQADRRAIIESGLLSVVPWVLNFGPVKTLVDIGITYSALADGLDTFVDQGKVTFLPERFQSSVLQKTIHVISDPLSALSSKKKSPELKYSLGFPFNEKSLKFLIGTESEEGNNGLRKHLKGIFEFLGCNPPLYFLDNNGNVVVEFNGEVKPHAEHEHSNSEDPKKPRSREPEDIIRLKDDQFDVRTDQRPVSVAL
jgi:hypothetical protein